MKSIDNMREYALAAAIVNATTRAVLAGYVDEIEREVEALADERDLLKTQWEAGVDFDQRLESCAENREDVTLFGVDYTALPLDADDEPIRVGNWIDVGDGKQRVEAVTPDAVYWWEEDGCHWVNAHMVTRHNAPTVEDVLREFWSDVDLAVADCGDPSSIIAEYAAKLRLAGEDE